MEATRRLSLQMIVRVWRDGVRIAYDQTRVQGFMSSGLTYPDPRLNNWFDRGANVGEAVGRLVNRILD